MLQAFAKKIAGWTNERKLASVRPIVSTINELEQAIRTLDDDALRAKTAAFKAQFQRGESLDKILPEAFAICREAARRVLGLRAFDVQLIGAIFLHRRTVVEMQTGEGKTLVAIFPAYLNALTGKGVHIITANEYLARRDAETMGEVYKALGLSVAVVSSQQNEATKRAAYAADITYSTHSELGFDYLRDNMKASLKDIVQRGHHYAIIDEADNIMLDEGLTPLVIAGPQSDTGELYKLIDIIVSDLEPEHFDVDKTTRRALFTELGFHHLEQTLQQKDLIESGKDLFDPENASIVNHLHRSLQARNIFLRDQHYVVHDGRVILINESTGRTMPSRRLGEGLHQAIEAKEGVAVQAESAVRSSISSQNFLRLYIGLAGMTGTAVTDADEFMSTFGLEVVQIPPNRTSQRKDEKTRSFRTADEKMDALLAMIRDAHSCGQPVLVGTKSIEKSELLSAKLTIATIPHRVLNAHHHEEEATIIADAGRLGAVTIATNMAGRGTDIQLGGYLNHTEAFLEDRTKVLEAGGLLVIGAEHYESRRIDNQLRGRSGRQGDPGRTCFFVSLEDDLLRLFVKDECDKIYGSNKGRALTAGSSQLVSMVELAQSKSQNRHFNARKSLLEYDDVVNEQRKTIFDLRRTILQTNDLGPMIADMRKQAIKQLVDVHVPHDHSASDWGGDELQQICQDQLGISIPVRDWLKEPDINRSILTDRIEAAADSALVDKFNRFGNETAHNFGKQILLKIIDSNWCLHVSDLEELKRAVGLRVYASRVPLVEFKIDSFAMFQTMLARISIEFMKRLSQIEPMDRQSQTQLLAQFIAKQQAGSPL